VRQGRVYVSQNACRFKAGRLLAYRLCRAFMMKIELCFLLVSAFFVVADGHATPCAAPRFIRGVRALDFDVPPIPLGVIFENAQIESEE